VLVYYITDRTQFPGTEPERVAKLLETIADAARWGVDYIQLREKDFSLRDFEKLGRSALAAVRKSSSSAKLLINSRVDVAIAIGADGVHLRSGNTDISPSEARIVFHKSGNVAPIISCSCHTLEELAGAEADGADFAVFGPVFGKSAEGTGVGVAALKEICQREIAASSRMPVLALGGITLENAKSCLDAGAAGIAGIRLFQTGNIGQTITQVRRLRPQAAAAIPRRRHPYQPS
jgi:thiamine-phosphate pyrophosphorylase